MSSKTSDYDVIVDYVTGKSVPNVGTEEIRQCLEKYLVEEKGFRKQEILVDGEIEVNIDGDLYQSRLDLVVSVENTGVMVIKCAAGSLESREREVVSAARIFSALPVPLAVASDCRTAVVYDGVSGKKIGEGLDSIPSRAQAVEILSGFRPEELPENKKKKEKIIFRSYDSMNVNVVRENRR